MSNPTNPLLRGFELSLKTEGRPASTTRTYVKAVAAYLGWCETTDVDPLEATTTDLRQWVSDLQERLAPNTINSRATTLKIFYSWLADEGDIPSDPSRRLRVPRKGEVQTPVLSDDELRLLFKTVSGNTFNDTRDYALLHTLLSTGLRRAELLAMTISGTDLSEGHTVIRRKGGKVQVVPLGAKTCRILQKYLRRRARIAPDEDAMWVSAVGDPIGYDAVGAILRRRGREAGVEALHPHVLRHTWAHKFRQAGGSEGDLMILGGWRERTMLDRYGSSGAASRAAEAARRYSPGDGF